MICLGVDLGGTNLRVGLLDRAQVLWKRSVPTEAWRGKEHVLEAMTDLVAEGLAEARSSGAPVAGIGVGLPGPVNPFTGIVSSPPNLPGWGDVPLRDLLASRFSLPVHVNNDANAAALGEWLFGAGRGHQHLVYVTISTGIGGGVVSEGTLLIGAGGGAAEIGHICLQAQHGAPCGCGRSGCFEAYASGTAMVREAKSRLAIADAASLLQAGEISPAAIAQAAAQGDALALGVLAQARLYLGVGLANVLTLYNPAVLILGGGVTNLWDELIEPALLEMRRLTFAPNVNSLLVTQPTLGPDAGLVGAAALVTYYQQI